MYGTEVASKHITIFTCYLFEIVDQNSRLIRIEQPQNCKITWYTQYTQFNTLWKHYQIGTFHETADAS